MVKPHVRRFDMMADALTSIIWRYWKAIDKSKQMYWDAKQIISVVSAVGIDHVINGMNGTQDGSVHWT